MPTNNRPGDVCDAAIVTVLLIQKIDNRFVTEEIACLPEAGNFKVTSLPVHARNLAVDDVIQAEFDHTDQAYFFQKKITPSGNSTIRVHVDEVALLRRLHRQLENGGCTCDLSLSKRLLIVNVPKPVNYHPIKQLLVQGEQQGSWQFEEACMAHCPWILRPTRSQQEVQQLAQAWREEMAKALLECRETRPQTAEAVAYQLSLPTWVIHAIETGDSSVNILHYLMACAYYGIHPYETCKSKFQDGLIAQGTSLPLLQ